MLLKVLDALSNPYRLKIIAVLHKDRQYVSQMARELGISRPLLYLHLKKLEEAGLIKGEHEISNDGKAMKYFELLPFSFQLDAGIIAEASESISDKKKE
ncbi:ArsR/SmtB family transcription factor [Metabacillus sp. JX24]|uniref:ArsR/SmtB family transcription factor n=1 Tax=Metabacillus sp. JX24 TaxID=3240759 RepID=UPI00350F5BBB